ncbi:unnamed protein product [Lupinus luteus]|uniref:F-box/kelch-repeat protein SKIP6 n=1 Tax=Lupinus luteus TaxID=3873 RepID=A0AAV1XDQ7_LUPLU
MSSSPSFSSSESESETPHNLIPSLPDDVAINCLSRVPRSHHPTLSLLSKPIHSLLSSPLFFSSRSSPEHLLYLTLRPRASPLQHFTLHLNPFTNRRYLVPLPPTPSPSVGSAYAVLGPTIYVIGGSRNDIPFNHVWLLDCRFHRWIPGPSMRVGREFPAAGVVDGKIYVIGGCVADTWSRSAAWAEVFDPAVNRWERVASPVEFREKWMHASAVIGGKFYAMADRGGMVFDPRSGVWESVGREMDNGWRGRACVVDEVLYCYDYLGKIKGFDVRSGVWKEVKGLGKGLLPRFLCGATMANVGGKLVVVWECDGNGKEMEVWCAEIEVKMDGTNGELLGEVGWIEKVLCVPKGSSIVQCCSVTL